MAHPQEETSVGPCPKCGHEPINVAFIGATKVQGYILILFSVALFGFWLDSAIRLHNRDPKLAVCAVIGAYLLQRFGRSLKNQEPTVELSCDMCDFNLAGAREEVEFGLASARAMGGVPAGAAGGGVGGAASPGSAGAGAASAAVGGAASAAGEGAQVVARPPEVDDRERVVRGGSYSDEADRCRSAARDMYQGDFRSIDTGFRLALIKGSTEASSTPKGAGSTYTTTTGIEMVWLKPATFKMGSPKGEKERKDDEKEPHEVDIEDGFWLAVHPVTVSQYEETMKTNKPWEPSDKDKPVTAVSFFDASHFCSTLTARERAELPEGWKFSLPSEKQWEYACRAGTETAYSFGDTITKEQAIFLATAKDSLESPAPVGGRPANGFGLCDMHGNVREWCLDLYE